MVEEKKNDGADDPINLLLEQDLTRQRNEMMENFAHILQRLPIESDGYSSSGHFGGTLPFKVQVNFDIPVFKKNKWEFGSANPQQPKYDKDGPNK
jgi:hypothetical protein